MSITTVLIVPAARLNEGGTIVLRSGLRVSKKTSQPTILSLEEGKKRGRESLFGKASLLGHHLRTLNDRHPSKLARHLFRDGG